jgi:hypothetical protein
LDSRADSVSYRARIEISANVGVLAEPRDEQLSALPELPKQDL